MGTLKLLTIIIASVISFVLLKNLAVVPYTRAQQQSQISKKPVASNAGINNLQDIKNETIGFEKLLVINLPERSDKRDAFTLAASLTNLRPTYIDGVKGESVLNKSLPWLRQDRDFTDPQLGSWRAHMNAIRTVVEKRLSSALIMEDDVDWDIHLKSQLLDLAHGTRYLQNQSIEEQTHSPYGDGWDILWLGHCHDTKDKDDTRVYVVKNDPTVPANKELHMNNHELLSLWPDYSRVIHVTGEPICTFAYAVSYKGAQKILYALSVKELRGLFDNALSWMCSGKDHGVRCLSAHPAYFTQYRARGSKGKNSDNNPDAEGSDAASSINLRFSTRLNLEQLLVGSQNYHDSYPRDQLA